MNPFSDEMTKMIDMGAKIGSKNEVAPVFTRELIVEALTNEMEIQKKIKQVADGNAELEEYGEDVTEAILVMLRRKLPDRHRQVTGALALASAMNKFALGI